MANFPYTGLTGEARLTDDGQLVTFGFTLDGVFIAFGQLKSGGVLDDLAEAEAQAEPSKSG